MKFKIVVRAEECREYIVEAQNFESALADFEQIDAGDRGEPDKCFWNSEDIDDPVELCDFCGDEKLNNLGLWCCSAALQYHLSNQKIRNK